LRTQISSNIPQRASNPTPLAILTKLASANPKLSDKQLRQLFWAEIRDDDDLLEAITSEWFVTARSAARSRVVSPVVRERRKVETKQLKDKTKAALVAGVRKVARIMLLDMVMPNGKKLAELTGTECAALGPQMNGFLTKVAARVKPNQKVGAVMSEDALWKLFTPS